MKNYLLNNTEIQNLFTKLEFKNELAKEINRINQKDELSITFTLEELDVITSSIHIIYNTLVDYENSKYRDAECTDAHLDNFLDIMLSTYEKLNNANV